MQYALIQKEISKAVPCSTEPKEYDDSTKKTIRTMSLFWPLHNNN